MFRFSLHGTNKPDKKGFFVRSRSAFNVSLDIRISDVLIRNRIVRECL